MRNAFANVDGDVVGGDKYVLLLGGRRERLRRLSPLTVERVLNAYQESPALGEAREVLHRRRLVILRGSEGYGKTAMAVRLLLGTGAEPLYHLDRRVDLASLAERLEDGRGGHDGHDGGVAPRAGFLLDDPDGIAGLRGEVYEKVRGALAEAGAFLVLTVSGTGLADSDLLSGVLDITEPPDQRGVVACHLRWLLGHRAAAEVLARADIGALLDERLAGVPSCRQAADLAAAVAEEWKDGRGTGAPDLERIRARSARLDAEDFEIWAEEELRDPALRGHAVALAVLSGLPHEDVAQAAGALERRLVREADAHTPAHARTPAGPEGGRAAPRRREPFDTPLRTRLARLRARTVPRKDGAPGDAVEYKDPSYAPQVLRHAWSGYGVQHVLLDWLHGLAGDVSEDVRVRAGAALGLLARRSFPYLSEHVLGAWAHGDDPPRRTAVAYALYGASEDEWCRERAARLVHDWYADRNSPFGQATAARAYGLRAGGLDTDACLRALGRLCAVDRMSVAVAVGYACVDLLAGDEDASLAPKVLGVLVAGTEDHRRTPASLLAFLTLAAQLVVDRRRWPTGGSLDEWPALLYFAHVRDELRTPFVRLWRKSLEEPFFLTEAQQVLANWAALAERDDRLREIFALMIGAVVCGERRVGQIVRQCAVDWTDPDHLAPLPATAAVVHAVLDREGA
ncbi:hypothetical protein ABT104_32205 [Streptomyces mobaraensis]|uniref:hypothetical protein n=1 Tax=Streptomyces mobaraensis TaxID=35621 RepID=UPI00332998FC